MHAIYFPACSGVCEGQQRCFGTDGDQCCNFYHPNKHCVDQCPDGLTGDEATGVCGK